MSIDIEKAKAGEPCDVYLIQSIERGWTSVHEQPLSTYITLAKGKVVFEFVDVESAINEGLAAIDKKIQEVRAKVEIEVNELKDRKAQLLSLTHQAD